MTRSVTLAAEGRIDIAILRRLVRDAGLTDGYVYGGKGKANLDLRLGGFNNAARFEPWIVLRDLDHDATCAAELIRGKLPRPAEWMSFRIAVREAEAWLLADREALSRVYHIPLSALPHSPESLEAAKRAFLDVLGQSRSRSIRESMTRIRAGASTEIGPEYNARLESFALIDWQPELARKRSKSLDKACERIEELAERIKTAWPQ